MGALVAFVAGCGALTIAGIALSDKVPTSPTANVVQVLVMLGAGVALLAVAVVFVGGLVAVIVVADAQRHQPPRLPTFEESGAGEMPPGTDQIDMLTSHRHPR